MPRCSGVAVCLAIAAAIADRRAAASALTSIHVQCKLPANETSPDESLLEGADNATGILPQWPRPDWPAPDDHDLLAVLAVVDATNVAHAAEFVAHYIEEGFHHVFLLAHERDMRSAATEDVSTAHGTPPQRGPLQPTGPPPQVKVRRLERFLACIDVRMATVLYAADLAEDADGPPPVVQHASVANDQLRTWLNTAALARVRKTGAFAWVAVVDLRDFVHSRACAGRTVASLLRRELAACTVVYVPRITFSWCGRELDKCATVRTSNRRRIRGGGSFARGSSGGGAGSMQTVAHAYIAKVDAPTMLMAGEPRIRDNYRRASACMMGPSDRRELQVLAPQAQAPATKADGSVSADHARPQPRVWIKSAFRKFKFVETEIDGFVLAANHYRLSWVAWRTATAAKRIAPADAPERASYIEDEDVPVIADRCEVRDSALADVTAERAARWSQPSSRLPGQGVGGGRSAWPPIFNLTTAACARSATLMRGEGPAGKHAVLSSDDCIVRPKTRSAVSTASLNLGGGLSAVGVRGGASAGVDLGGAGAAVDVVLTAASECAPAVAAGAPPSAADLKAMPFLMPAPGALLRVIDASPDFDASFRTHRRLCDKGVEAIFGDSEGWDSYCVSSGAVRKLHERLKTFFRALEGCLTAVLFRRSGTIEPARLAAAQAQCRMSLPPGNFVHGFVATLRDLVSVGVQAVAGYPYAHLALELASLAPGAVVAHSLLPGSADEGRRPSFVEATSLPLGSLHAVDPDMHLYQAVSSLAARGANALEQTAAQRHTAVRSAMQQGRRTHTQYWQLCYGTARKASPAARHSISTTRASRTSRASKASSRNGVHATNTKVPSEPTALAPEGDWGGTGGGSSKASSTKGVHATNTKVPSEPTALAPEDDWGGTGGGSSKASSTKGVHATNTKVPSEPTALAPEDDWGGTGGSSKGSGEDDLAGHAMVVPSEGEISWRRLAVTGTAAFNASAIVRASAIVNGSAVVNASASADMATGVNCSAVAAEAALGLGQANEIGPKAANGTGGVGRVTNATLLFLCGVNSTDSSTTNITDPGPPLPPPLPWRPDPGPDEFEPVSCTGAGAVEVLARRMASPYWYCGNW